MTAGTFTKPPAPNATKRHIARSEKIGRSARPPLTIGTTATTIPMNAAIPHAQNTQYGVGSCVPDEHFTATYTAEAASAMPPRIDCTARDSGVNTHTAKSDKMIERKSAWYSSVTH